MTTALLGNLVLNVDSRSTGTFHFADGAGDVEGATPAGINIDQQRYVGSCGDTANVLDHVVQGGHAQIRQAVGGIGDAATGQVDGLVAHFIGHHGGIGVDGADNLQGLVVFERLAEAGAGAEFVGHGVGLFH